MKFRAIHTFVCWLDTSLCRPGGTHTFWLNAFLLVDVTNVQSVEQSLAPEAQIEIVLLGAALTQKNLHRCALRIEVSLGNL